MAANIKESLGKLSFLKSYSSLVIPIIIAVVGILIFIPTQLMSSKLQSEISEKSISKANQINSLIQAAPPKEQWKQEQRYQQSYQEDAKRMASLVGQSSKRQLLRYNIFPKPEDESRLIFQDFARKYRQAIEEFVSKMNAGDCPTQAELQRKMVTGRQSTSAAKSEIEDVLCREKAQSISLYATPSLFPGYEFWENYQYEGQEKGVEDCWYWQVGYWIIEDVVDTIASMNEGSRSVFTSDVKRLMNLGFSIKGRSFGATWGGNVTKGRPYYVQHLGGGLAIPCTGRYSNSEIDVVHFYLSVLVSRKAVPEFMGEICSAKEHIFKGFDESEPAQRFKHNQITILETRIQAVDLKSPEHEMYRYGEDAVVELSLICEYVFDKEGYEAVKPEVVKKEQGG